MRCCCGKYDLEDGEPYIANTTRHEAFGKGNFCGPEINHRLRDAENSIEKLTNVLRRLVGTYMINDDFMETENEVNAAVDKVMARLL